MALAYVGDAVEAAGFRLAGVRCWVPGTGDAVAAFDAASAAAEVVVIEPAVASALPRGRLDAALVASRPLTVIIPRACGSELDPVERVQTLLGLEP
jgi:vacuolar-type H+-ATPase subunit F/Vma7